MRKVIIIITAILAMVSYIVGSSTISFMETIVEKRNAQISAISLP